MESDLSAFMKAMRRDLKLVLLYLLKDGPKHGYLLMKELRRLKGLTAYEPGPGTIYPALKSLVKEGLVEVRIRGSGGRIVKEYVITEEGLRRLEEGGERLRKVFRIFTAVRLLEGEGLREFGRAFAELLTVVPDMDEGLRKEVAEALRECSERFREILAKSLEGGGHGS